MSRFDDITYDTLVAEAIEALELAGLGMKSGHPEDLASNLMTALPMVAAGFHWGYTYHREYAAREVNSAYRAQSSTYREGDFK